MARLALTPTVLTKATPLNATSGQVALTGFTGVSYVNTGREFLVFVVGSTASTLTENIGLTIQGQTVAAPTPALTTSATNIVGPFPSQFNQTDGSNNIFIDLSSVVGVTVMLCQMPGVS